MSNTTARCNTIGQHYGRLGLYGYCGCDYGTKPNLHGLYANEVHTYTADGTVCAPKAPQQTAHSKPAQPSATHTRG